MLVDRPSERDFLKKAYQRMQQDRCLQVSFLQGEAGSGKTSLVHLFINELLAQQPSILVFTGFCHSHGDYCVPYQPFKDLLKRIMLEVTKAPTAEKRNEPYLFAAQMFTENAPDLLESFVSVNKILRYPHVQAEASETHSDLLLDESSILKQYAHSLGAIAAHYPMVIFLDNLQWIDNASAHLLKSLAGALAEFPILFVGAYRGLDSNGNAPLEHVLSLKSGSQVHSLDLDSLPVTEKENFLNKLLDSEPNLYSRSFRKQMMQHTSASPLFVSELMAWFRDKGMVVRNSDGLWVENSHLQWRSFPQRIEEVIQEKISKLSKQQLHYLKYASVQGNQILIPVLSKMVGESEHLLLTIFNQELSSEFQLVHALTPSSSYQGMGVSYYFNNTLLQQYLYYSLNAGQRKLLHGDVASILESLFKDRLDEVADQIACHFEYSDNFPKSLEYNKRVVESMMRISAFYDAILVLNKAQDLLRKMFQDTETQRELLEVQVRLCICHRYVKGWGHPEMAGMYNTAKKMSETLQDNRFMDTILFGLWTIHFTRLELKECLQMATANLNLAQQKKSICMQRSALIALANTHCWMGHISRASQALEVFWNLAKGNRDLQAENENEEAFAYLFSYMMSSKMKDATLRAKNQQALLQRVESTQDQVCQTLYLQALAWVAALENDFEMLEKYSQKFLDNSRKLHLVFYEGIALLFSGYLLAQTDYPAGVATIESGYRLLLDHNQCDVVVMHSVYALLLNRCYLAAGHGNQVQDLLPQFITRSEYRDERLYLSELCHLLGSCYEAQGDLSLATTWFAKAQLEAALI